MFLCECPELLLLIPSDSASSILSDTPISTKMNSQGQSSGFLFWKFLLSVILFCGSWLPWTPGLSVLSLQLRESAGFPCSWVPFLPQALKTLSAVCWGNHGTHLLFPLAPVSLSFIAWPLGSYKLFHSNGFPFPWLPQVGEKNWSPLLHVSQKHKCHVTSFWLLC